MKQNQDLPPPLEHQTMQQIVNYLKYKGWYVMRLNSGRYSVGEGRSRRYIMGQEKGTPDLLAFKPVIRENRRYREIEDLLFIEVKRQGNKPTELQLAKMRELEEYGARCLVIHSLEELQAEGI